MTVKEFRESKHLQLCEVVKQSGIKKETLEKIEQGNIPTTYTLNKLLAFFELSADDIKATNNGIEIL